MQISQFKFLLVLILALDNLSASPTIPGELQESYNKIEEFRVNCELSEPNCPVVSKESYLPLVKCFKEHTKWEAGITDCMIKKSYQFSSMKKGDRGGMIYYATKNFLKNIPPKDRSDCIDYEIVKKSNNEITLRNLIHSLECMYNSGGNRNPEAKEWLDILKVRLNEAMFLSNMCRNVSENKAPHLLEKCERSSFYPEAASKYAGLLENGESHFPYVYNPSEQKTIEVTVMGERPQGEFHPGYNNPAEALFQNDFLGDSSSCDTFSIDYQPCFNRKDDKRVNLDNGQYYGCLNKYVCDNFSNGSRLFDAALTGGANQRNQNEHLTAVTEKVRDRYQALRTLFLKKIIQQNVLAKAIDANNCDEDYEKIKQKIQQKVNDCNILRKEEILESTAGSNELRQLYTKICQNEGRSTDTFKRKIKSDLDFYRISNCREQWLLLWPEQTQEKSKDRDRVFEKQKLLIEKCGKDLASATLNSFRSSTLFQTNQPISHSEKVKLLKNERERQFCVEGSTDLRVIDVARDDDKIRKYRGDPSKIPLLEETKAGKSFDKMFQRVCGNSEDPLTYWQLDELVGGDLPEIEFDNENQRAFYKSNFSKSLGGCDLDLRDSSLTTKLVESAVNACYVITASTTLAAFSGITGPGGVAGMVAADAMCLLPSGINYKLQSKTAEKYRDLRRSIGPALSCDDLISLGSKEDDFTGKAHRSLVTLISLSTGIGATNIFKLATKFSRFARIEKQVEKELEFFLKRVEETRGKLRGNPNMAKLSEEELLELAKKIERHRPLSLSKKPNSTALQFQADLEKAIKTKGPEELIKLSNKFSDNLALSIAKFKKRSELMEKIKAKVPEDVLKQRLPCMY